MNEVSELLQKAISSMGASTVAEVVDYAYKLDADVFSRNGAQLARKQAESYVRNLMHRQTESEAEDQLLPGLHFPARIAITRADGETLYVPHEDATWPQLLVGKGQRQDNVFNAQKRLELYEQSMAELRPYMEAEPLMTVRQAVALRDKRRRDVDGDGDFFGFAPA